MNSDYKQTAAVFLDRDGTINEEIGYMDSLEKLRLIPGAAEAIRLINSSGMKAIVVTNQSGVARGIFTESFVAETHARLLEMLGAEGASIDSFHYCPHHPTEGKTEYIKTCDCRKPAPGMILRAAAELGIDTKRSYMVGDTLKDIEAGCMAGARGILVRTGYGEEAVAELGPEEEQRQNGKVEPDAAITRPAHIADDLLAAVKWIMENGKR